MGLDAEDFWVYFGARRNFSLCSVLYRETKIQRYRLRHQKAQGMSCAMRCGFNANPRSAGSRYKIQVNEHQRKTALGSSNTDLEGILSSRRVPGSALVSRNSPPNSLARCFMPP